MAGLCLGLQAPNTYQTPGQRRSTRDASEGYPDAALASDAGTRLSADEAIAYALWKYGAKAEARSLTDFRIRAPA
jgi:hypothetical protein